MNEQMNVQGGMVPLKEWAAHYDVSVRTVHNYLAANKLSSPQKVNGSWMIDLDEQPPAKAAGTIVVGEHPSTRPASAPNGEVVAVTTPQLMPGTGPMEGLLPDTILAILDRSPLWIKAELAARIIGCTKHALIHELADEYNLQKIGGEWKVPQWRLRKELVRED